MDLRQNIYLQFEKYIHQVVVIIQLKGRNSEEYYGIATSFDGEIFKLSEI